MRFLRWLIEGFRRTYKTDLPPLPPNARPVPASGKEIRYHYFYVTDKDGLRTWECPCGCKFSANKDGDITTFEGELICPMKLAAAEKMMGDMQN